MENTCPTKGPEKEMKNQIDWAMPTLKEKCGKNAEQLKWRRKSAGLGLRLNLLMGFRRSRDLFFTSFLRHIQKIFNKLKQMQLIKKIKSLDLAMNADFELNWEVSAEYPKSPGISWFEFEIGFFVVASFEFYFMFFSLYRKNTNNERNDGEK